MTKNEGLGREEFGHKNNMGMKSGVVVDVTKISSRGRDLERGVAKKSQGVKWNDSSRELVGGSGEDEIDRRMGIRKTTSFTLVAH